MIFVPSGLGAGGAAGAAIWVQVAPGQAPSTSSRQVLLDHVAAEGLQQDDVGGGRIDGAVDGDLQAIRP